MIFDDSWTTGLTQKQQSLIVDYVMNGCKVYPGIAGYKSLPQVKKWLDGEKGRRAVRAYCNFFFDKKKDVVKLQLLKIYLKRAFFNPADIINSKGMILDEYRDNLKKLGDLSYCIDGIKLTTQSLEIKLCDRDKARDFIVQLFKIMEDDFDESLDDEKSVFEMTDEERDEEIQKLVERTGLLPPPNEKGKKKGKER